MYEGLVRVVGRRKISVFLENLARPFVVGDDLAKERLTSQLGILNRSDLKAVERAVKIQLHLPL